MKKPIQYFVEYFKLHGIRYQKHISCKNGNQLYEKWENDKPETIDKEVYDKKLKLYSIS